MKKGNESVLPLILVTVAKVMSVQGTQIFLIAKKNALCYAKPVEEKTNAKGLMEAAPVH